MDETSKDNRLKYIEMPAMFYNMANDIEIAAKQHLKQCETMAKRVVKMKAKTPEQQESIDNMKEFLLATHNMNTQTVLLLNKVHRFLDDVAKDANMLIEGAVCRDKLADASTTIQIAWEQRDKLVNELYDRRTIKGTS